MDDDGPGKSSSGSGNGQVPPVCRPLKGRCTSFATLDFSPCSDEEYSTIHGPQGRIPLDEPADRILVSDVQRPYEVALSLGGRLFPSGSPGLERRWCSWRR